MLVYEIGLTIAEIIIICGVVFATQLYITKILLQNVNNRIAQLDNTLAEAIQSVVEANLGEFQQQNPLIGIISDIMKQNITKNNQSDSTIVEIPRSSDGKFTSLK
jgi:low affinity Fe/Cu permease